MSPSSFHSQASEASTLGLPWAFPAPRRALGSWHQLLASPCCSLSPGLSLFSTPLSLRQGLAYKVSGCTLPTMLNTTMPWSEQRRPLESSRHPQGPPILCSHSEFLLLPSAWVLPSQHRCTFVRSFWSIPASMNISFTVALVFLIFKNSFIEVYLTYSKQHLFKVYNLMVSFDICTFP